MVKAYRRHFQHEVVYKWFLYNLSVHFVVIFVIYYGYYIFRLIVQNNIINKNLILKFVKSTICEFPKITNQFSDDVVLNQSIDEFYL